MSFTSILIAGVILGALMSIPKEWMAKADEETTAYLEQREPRAYHYALAIFFIIYLTTLLT